MLGRMEHIRPLLLALLFVGTLAATACTGTAGSSAPGTASDGAQQVALTVANAMTFEPPAITVRVGQPVVLTLRNSGQLQHDFVLVQDVAQPVRVVADAGQTARGVFTIDAAGTYSFECSIPGHAGAGMRGTLTAQ
jgi:uncharacterized cupredoxin-like copper-binding protein